jgi:hypothetical protein
VLRLLLVKPEPRDGSDPRPVLYPMSELRLFSQVNHPRFGRGVTDSAVSLSTGTVRVFFRDRDRLVKAADLRDERNSSLLHLLALTQGKRAEARRRWERAVYPNGILDETLDAATARLRYLTDFLRTRTLTRRLP